MKKIILLCTVLLLSIPMLTGCKKNNNTPKNSTSSSSELNIETQKIDGLGKANVIDGLEITVNKPEKKEIKDSKKDMILYTIHVKGKNISSVSKGLGSIDFRLQTKDGKQHSVSTKYNIFGKEINPNEEIEGDLYFELDKKDDVDQLVYLLSDQKHIVWNLNNN
ncbi:DUF4352 domain-containing protein [Enterococcus hirae]|uniref:DUF4352 domain-containing protein n=1 Tax=Enterococcus hirae TaxID=1354 RepID=UPI00391D033C